MMVKMNRLLFSILVAFTSTMAFAQSNIFDGITERGIKLYQSREAEIDEIVRLQPQYLDIPNDPNSISAKNKLYTLQKVLKYSLRIGDEQSLQLAKIVIAKKYNAINLPKPKEEIVISSTSKVEQSVYPMQSAYDFKVGSIYYKFLSAVERAIEVTISESGYTGNVSIPARVTYKNDDYWVTAIGDSAFWSCSGLTSVTIPYTVTYIGRFAFQNCSNLTSLTLRGSNIHMGTKAFENCTSLNTLAIPDDSPIDAESFLDDCGYTGGGYTIKRFQGASPQIIANRSTQRRTNSNNDDVSDTQFYKGNFKMVGFGYGVNIHDVEGVATYHYRTASDGTRIFEGDFSFGGEIGHNKAYGKFKNDKQVGIWKWEILGLGEDNTCCEIPFDENGILNGKFNMWIGIGETTYKRSWISCVFENGRITSVSYRDRNIITAQGQYNSQGVPMGIWTVTGKGFKNKNCTFAYDNNGHLKEAYYIDNTTGDKVEVYSEYPQQIYGIIVSSINKHCFRSTPKVKN